MNRSIRPALLATACVLSCAVVSGPRAEAQLPTADVAGTVSDPSGAVIPNAKVTVKNSQTGETRSSQTDAGGSYSFTLLQLGTYDLIIEAQGFKGLTQHNVVLNAGSNLRVDLALSLGNASETVEVSTQPPAIQTDSSTIGGSIGQKSVESLPLNGRNFMSLAYLAPGASEGNANGFSSGTRPDDRRNSSEITVNAQNDSVNVKTIDGMDNNERYINSIGVQPSIEAIQEVRVLTNLYTAEVGRTAGAVVDVVTKSGTNAYHGSVYEYFRNSVFDARNYFNTVSQGKKPGLKQNQYGGAIGGRILRDKTFFFADYEGVRLSQNLAVPLATVPTACQQGLAACNGVTQLGNFSDITTQIYNPVDGTAYTNNIIPVSQISQVSQNFAKLYPAPNLSGTVNNFVSTPNRSQNGFTVDGRIDHHINDANSISGRYTANSLNTVTPTTFPITKIGSATLYGGGDLPNSINTFSGTAKELAQNAAIIYTHIFTPKVLLQANFGYLRVAINSTAPNTGTNGAASLGLVGINNPAIANGAATGVPYTNLTGYNNIGDDNFVPLRTIDNTYQYNANVSWTPGTHVFKFGAGYIPRQFNNVQSQYPNGNFVFDQTPTRGQTANGFTGSGGNAFASLLLGYPSTVTRALSLISPQYSVHEPNIYVQDTWRATKWLTLNMGLRYDIFTPYREKHNLISNFNPTTGLLQQASPGDPYAQLRVHYNSLAPRFGFAVVAPHGFVVHGGFGTSFFPASYASQFSLKNAPTSSLFQSSFSTKYNTAGNPTVAAAARRFTDPLPNPTATPVTCGTPATVNNCPSGTINGVSPDWRASYAYQTNLQIQKDVFGTVVTLGYAGVFGRALSGGVNINQLNTPGPQPAGTALLLATPQSTQPFFKTSPLNPVIVQQRNGSAGHYHGLTVGAERRATNGLTLFANYTYSKEIDNEIYPGLNIFPACAPMYDCIVDNGNGSTHTVRGLNYDKGIGQNNVTNHWAIAATYQIPFGRDFKGASRQAFQGWTLNTLATWSTGAPFTVQEGTSTILSQTVGSGSNTNGSRPNLVGNPKPAKPSPAAWFNVAAFGAQQIGTLGNAPRNLMTGPPLRKWDASLFKDFPIHDELHAQFRWEVFNLTNTASFATPNTVISSFTGGSSSGVATTAGGLGTITSTASNATPRQMQFVMKIIF